MSGHSSDEVMDDGLHIKPPQPHSRRKDRKRDRSHRHGQGHVSKSRKDLTVDDGESDRRRHERRHHRRGMEDDRGRHRDREAERMELDRLERKGLQELKNRERELNLSLSKHRSSGPSRRHEEQGKIGSRDVLLSEVKKERRHVELENERVMREIEKRREKEMAFEDVSDHSSSRHRGEDKRSRRDRERNRAPVTPPNEEEVDLEQEKRLFDDRLNIEVQDIEDSASDLEEGEQRSVSANSKEDKEHGDASDVSSASENETEEKPVKATSDVSSTSGSSRKSQSDGKSDVSSSSSSNSDSDSDQEKDVNGDEEPQPKIPRKDSPSPIQHSDDKVPEPEKQMSEDSAEIPVVVVTAEEDEEEELLPPYFPALQGCRRVEEFQLLNRIEEGTYGVVYRAKEKRTDEVVALKRLKMEKEKDGFPITSLREINTLLKAQHENIVTVREIVVGSNTDKIFLVMDYVEHDLKALMETLKQKGQVFLPEEVKCLMIQLLRAVAHLHDNWILHRDLKTSNLLLSHKGILKVGDFGLAREYGSPLKSYTPIVVTLWYRAPELLLGTKEYSTPIDVWSVGCIFGELLKMEPMFPGKSEANQLNLIFQSLGTPNDRIWPGYTQLPMLQKMTFADYPVNKLKTRFGHLTDQGIDLMNKFLTFNPAKRITAEDALEHAFFKELPLSIDPSMFPTWPAKSEGSRVHRSSPKPPSGGHQFKVLKEDEGFFLGGGDARRQPTGAGFSLKF